MAPIIVQPSVVAIALVLIISSFFVVWMLIQEMQNRIRAFEHRLRHAESDIRRLEADVAHITEIEGIDQHWHTRDKKH